jgi:hypothetical protein
MSNNLSTAFSNATSNATLDLAMNATANITQTVMNKTANATAVKGNDDTIFHWTEHAFETCQFLLSHSAVFLLMVLVALNILMKSYNHKQGEQKAPNLSQLTATAASQRPDEEDTNTLCTPPMDHAPADIEFMSTNTYSTARPTTITVSISSSSVSSNDDHGGQQHHHHHFLKHKA